MESTKYLHYTELCRDFRAGDDAKVKKLIEEIINLKDAKWSEIEELNIAIISYLMTHNEKQLAEVLTKHGLSLKEVLMKVSIRNMKRKPTSTHSSTHWQLLTR
jgi:hypothetical protein